MPSTAPTVAAAPDASTSSSSSSGHGLQLYRELPGGGFDPLNWPQEAIGAGTNAAGSIASSAAGAVWSSVEPFLAKALFVVAGLALMGLGVYKIVTPSHSARDGLDQLGKSIGQAVRGSGEAAADAAVAA